jgi:hypothetical protein
MSRAQRIAVLSLIGTLAFSAVSFATASTHIWAPSTDIQSYRVVHLTYDAYVPVERDRSGDFPAPVTNLGLTVGVIPSSKIQAEVGSDHKAGFGDADRNPLYLNGKIAVPEAVVGYWQPALAAGIFDVGTREATGYNVFYVKGAKSFSTGQTALGRLSVGYFYGSKRLLVDEDGTANSDGVFGAWERTFTEISPKLTLCAEYMGSKSAYGCWSFGGSWKFTADVGVIAGYSHYNRDDLVGTATMQLDIDIH